MSSKSDKKASRKRGHDHIDDEKDFNGHGAGQPADKKQASEGGEAEASQGRQVIVLLDKASLETTKTKRNDFELLNCDDHRHIARKHGLDPAVYRPDILHQELLSLIDSPLNKAGHLKVPSCGYTAPSHQRTRTAHTKIFFSLEAGRVDRKMMHISLMGS